MDGRWTDDLALLLKTVDFCLSDLFSLPSRSTTEITSGFSSLCGFTEINYITVESNLIQLCSPFAQAGLRNKFLK